MRHAQSGPKRCEEREQKLISLFVLRRHDVETKSWSRAHQTRFRITRSACDHPAAVRRPLILVAAVFETRMSSERTLDCHSGLRRGFDRSLSWRTRIKGPTPLPSPNDLSKYLHPRRQLEIHPNATRDQGHYGDSRHGQLAHDRRTGSLVSLVLSS